MQCFMTEILLEHLYFFHLYRKNTSHQVMQSRIEKKNTIQTFTVP